MSTKPKLLLAVIASSMLLLGCSTTRHSEHWEYKTEGEWNESMAQSQPELIAYTSPPVDLPHHNGGLLRISASQIRTGLSVEVIRPGIEQCDILKLTKTIVDEDKQAHTFTTHISSYDLWDAVSDGIASTEDAYMRSWRFQKGNELVSVATNINIWSDGRGPRVLGLYVEPDQRPYLFAVHEKYFAATADLLIQRNPPYETGYQPSDDVVVRITVYQSFSDTTGQFELDHKTPIMVTVPSSLLLFANTQRKSVVDSEMGPTWNRSPLPQPIEVLLAGLATNAQVGVKWVKNTDTAPTKPSTATE